MSIKNPWRVCQADGCGKKHRRLLHLCGTHETHNRRNGHPTAYRVKYQDLNPFRPVVTLMIDRYAAHEAIVAALKVMEDILFRYGADDGRAAPGHRVRPYLDKVIRAGGDSRSALIEMAALAFFYHSSRSWPDEKVQVMAYANRLLLHIPGAGNSRHAWPRPIVSALGYRIIEQLRGFLLDMWIVHERTLKAQSDRQKVMRTFSEVEV